MNIKYFLTGPMIQMERPAFPWWCSKWLEYNIKFVSCVSIAQLLFLLVITSKVSHHHFFIAKLVHMLRADLLLIVLINVIYFVFPALEFLVFRKVNILFRKYTFQFLNMVSLAFPVLALVIVFLD